MLTHTPTGLAIKVPPSTHPPAPPAPKLGAKRGPGLATTSASRCHPLLHGIYKIPTRRLDPSLFWSSPHCRPHQAMCRMNPIPPSWPNEIPWDLTVNPSGSAVTNTPQKREPGEEAAEPGPAPARSWDFLGRDRAKGRAGLSGTSLQMSPSGARVRARPRWLSKRWSPGAGLLKQRVLGLFPAGLPVFVLQQVCLALRLGLLRGAVFLPGLSGAFCLARRLSPRPARRDQVLVLPWMGQEVRSAPEHPSEHLSYRSS